jgi:hypothetical protein
VPDEVLQQLGGIQDLVEVDSGLDLHLREHVDQVLGGDVGPGAGCVGADPRQAVLLDGDSTTVVLVNETDWLAPRLGVDGFCLISL